MLIIFATIIGGFIQGASARGMLEVFIKTIFQLKNSIVAIMAIVALATVMDLSGIISTLAQSIVDLTGSSYVFLAPVIGALGTFVTGSDTNSNILFGKLQTIAASKLHIDPNWLAAANTSGATGENDFAAKHRHRGFCHQNGRSGQPDYVWHHEILLRLHCDPRPESRSVLLLVYGVNHCQPRQIRGNRI